MTFILGTARLGYDYFGEWTRRLDCYVEAHDGVSNDPSQPGSAQPGTFGLAEDIAFPFRVTVTVIQEN